MPHGGQVWAAARQLGVTPDRILDFSANLNPWGPPAAVLDLLRQHAPDVAWYPEPYGGYLREDLASHLGLPPARLAIGNGACELLYAFCRVLSPATVLLPCPTFSEYARAAGACGGQTHPLFLRAEEEFRLPLAEIISTLRRQRYDLLVFGQPHNPTGTLITPAELEAVLAAAEQAGTWVLVDESFLGFSPEAERLSALGLPAARQGHLAILGSFTKLYCLPGLRLGYLIAPPELTARLEETRDPWSVNVLAQLAGRQCLREREYLARTRESLPRFRADLHASLAAIPGLRVFPSRANFLLCRIEPGGAPAGGSPSAREICERLARRLLLVRECSDFPGLDGSYFRVAVRLPSENQRLAETFREELGRWERLS